jgi:hypothetical protein
MGKAAAGRLCRAGLLHALPASGSNALDSCSPIAEALAAFSTRNDFSDGLDPAALSSLSAVVTTPIRAAFFVAFGAAKGTASALQVFSACFFDAIFTRVPIEVAAFGQSIRCEKQAPYQKSKGREQQSTSAHASLPWFGLSVADK